MARIISHATSTIAGPARRIPILRILLEWRALRRQRVELAALSDHQLRDIGVTRSAAETEARRPFWDAPAHWMRR